MVYDGLWWFLESHPNLCFFHVLSGWWWEFAQVWFRIRNIVQLRWPTPFYSQLLFLFMRWIKIFLKTYISPVKKNNNKSCSIKYVFVYVCHTRRWFWGSKKSHADISAPISRDHPHVFLDQSDCVRVKPPFLGRLGPWFFMIVSHSAVKQPSG